jgi:hypothetical protein
LLVPSDDIEGWLGNQRKQKGEGLLFMANRIMAVTSSTVLASAEWVDAALDGSSLKQQ